MSYATILVNGQYVRLEREPRSDSTIEKADLHNMVMFCDFDMGNFKFEPIQSSLEVANPVIAEIKNSKEDLWHMYFDGACNKEGSGAGVVFIAPSRKKFKYSF